MGFMGTLSKDCCLSEKPTKKRSAVRKSQSAMEYLMTYGWAILIIAIVLAALFSLGIFGSGTFTGTTCIANTGFLCTAPIVHGNTFTATMGQATGTTWNDVVLCYVPNGDTASSCTGFSSVDVGTLHSGQSETYSFTINSVSTSSSGSVWAQYSEKGYSNLMSQLAIATLTGLTPHPSAPPAPSINYVPVTLTNSQSSPTPAPFQQMIQIPESSYASYISYNGVSSNIEFTTSPGGAGTVIPAWIESNSSGTLTVWLKLSSSIAANSNTVVYLDFAPKTTNLLSSSGTSGIGEAPQLSSTYAEYDDGASVFTHYWNFAGTSLPTNWVASTDFTGSVNNGLTVTSSTRLSGVTYNVPSDYSNTIIDTYVTETAHQSLNIGLSEAALIGGANPPFANGYLSAVDSGGTGGSTLVYVASSTSQTNLVTTTFDTALSTPYIISMYWASPTLVQAINYANELSTSDSSYTSLSYLSLSVFTGATWEVKWLRTRAYPPSGVMPSVAFGSVS